MVVEDRSVVTRVVDGMNAVVVEVSFFPISYTNPVDEKKVQEVRIINKVELVFSYI